MPDGSIVPIYKDQPAPQEVVDAAQAVIAPLAAAVSASTEFDAAETDAVMWAEIERQGSLMGKTVIAVFYGYDYGNRAWVASNPVFERFPTKAEAIAAAQAFIGDSAHKYALMVFDQ